MPYAKINGADIYYQDQGQGFPVVFTHGLGSDHTMWAYQAGPFKEKYRVIMWDARGHGRSEVTADGYSLPGFLSDLSSLLELLGVEQAHLVGLSMGGLLSWSFAAAHPEKVRALVLSDAAGLMEGVDQKERDEKAKMFALSAAVCEQKGRTSLVDITLSLMFSREFVQKGGPAIDKTRERLEQDPGIGYARTIRGLFAEFWKIPDSEIKERLARVTAPTLIIAGDKDALTPLPTQKALHRAIPGSRLEIIEGSGHVPAIEKPEKWNRLALDFLDKK